MGRESTGSPTAGNDCSGFRDSGRGETRSGNRGSDATRFWAQIDRSGPPGSCWPWTGGKSVDRGGTYGWSAEHRQLAHIVAYELAVKPVPTGMLVRHRCHVPLCCNPGHLLPGTHKDNAQDAVRAGRTLRGESHPFAKLTEAQVGEIRRLRRLGISLKQLSRQYGIAAGTVSQVATGETWGHVGDKHERARRLATLRLVGDMRKGYQS